MRKRDYMRFLVVTFCVVTTIGCSGGEAAEDVPASPSPVVVTPEETITPTPEPVDEPTPESDPTEELEAEITDFFEEYVKVSDESWNSDEALERRREMFVDSCEICLVGYQAAERSLEEGLTFVGEPGEVRKLNITQATGDFVSILATIDAPPADLVDADGQIVQSLEGNLGSQVVYQVRKKEPGEWTIVKGDVL